MVAINQSKQPRSSQLRSRTLRSASEQSRNLEKRNHSSSHTFIVSQQTTKFFVANDLLVSGERIVDRRPYTSERSITQGLMRPHRVVINSVRSDIVLMIRDLSKDAGNNGNKKNKL